MLILAFVHALELKLHNIGKPVIDLRDLSTFAVYRVHRTLHPAPLQSAACTAPCFLHLAPLTGAPHPASCTLQATTCTAPWFLHWDAGAPCVRYPTR